MDLGERGDGEVMREGQDRGLVTGGIEGEGRRGQKLLKQESWVGAGGKGTTTGMRK